MKGLNMIEKKTNKLTPTRRKVILAGAAASAAPLLSAQTSPTNPPLLSSSLTRREVYHVEVVHKGVGYSRVRLGVWGGSSNGQFFEISKKLDTANATVHCADYATIDNNPAHVAHRPAATNYKEFRDQLILRLELGRTSETTWFYSVGGGAARDPAKVYAAVYIPPDGSLKYVETEYLFAFSGTPSPTNWNLAVRFHHERSNEIPENKSPDWVSEIVKGSTFHPHNQNKPTTYPVHHSNALIVPNSVRAGVIQEATTARDSLVLPDRHGHYRLVRPAFLGSKTGPSHNHASRAVKRHLFNFSEYLATQRGDTDATSEGKALALHNEISNVTLGPTYSSKLMQHLEAVRTSSINHLRDFNFDALLEPYLTSVNNSDNVELSTAIDRVLQEGNPTLSNFTSKLGLGIGVAGSASVQIGGAFNWLIPDSPPLKTGLRLSLVLARGFTSVNSGNTGNITTTTSKYNIRTDAADRGYKLQCTAVLGQAALPGEPPVIDMEFTAALTVKRVSGSLKCRVDSLVVDPVLDISHVGWLNKLLTECLVKAFSAQGNLSAATQPSYINASNAVASGVNNTQSYAAAHVNFAAAGITASATPYLGSIGPGLVAFAQNFLQSTSRTWGLTEISLFRAGLFNADTSSNYTGAFRGGFAGQARLIYYPGIKFLGGAGFEVKNTRANGYFRVFGGGDAHIIVSHRSYAELLSSNASTK